MFLESFVVYIFALCRVYSKSPLLLSNYHKLLKFYISFLSALTPVYNGIYDCLKPLFCLLIEPIAKRLHNGISGILKPVFSFLIKSFATYLNVFSAGVIILK